MIIGGDRNKDMGNHGDGIDGERIEKLVNPNNKEKTLVWAVFIAIFVFLLGFISFNTGFLISQKYKIFTEFKIMESMYERSAKLQEIKLTFIEYLMDPDLEVRNQQIRNINTEDISSIYINER